MPKSALPEHLNDKDEIENAFPDDSQYGDGWFGRLYKAYQKKTKTWFAFSYRCTEWWARWRKFPIILFAVRGEGAWRVEFQNGDLIEAHEPRVLFMRKVQDGYLSRIQYYTRWHFSIQWPLIVAFHFYPKAKDVPIVGQPRPELDGKLWFAYWNHFDADLVYWMVLSLYLGRNWK